jgi:hypothetical protein
MVASGPSDTDSQRTAEASLAAALDRASEAGRWVVVARLARDLEARRLAVAPVASFDDAQTRRVD